MIFFCDMFAGLYVIIGYKHDWNDQQDIGKGKIQWQASRESGGQNHKGVAFQSEMDLILIQKM